MSHTPISREFRSAVAEGLDLSWVLASHGVISVASVNPFAPTFDTVGILASSAEVLARVDSVLLACKDAPGENPGKIHLLKEAFYIADPDVRQVLEDPVQRLRELFGGRLAGDRRRVRSIGSEVGRDRELPQLVDRGNETSVRPRNRAELRSRQEPGPPSHSAARSTFES